MEQNDPKAFLGSGFRFPIQVDENTGRMMMSSYEENIKESIRIILSTRRGERIRNPEFGCGIHDYTFGSLDYTTLSAIRREVEQALVRWEPRIEEVEVALETQENEGLVLIEINYLVRSTNNPFNLVFPFYISEGYGGQT